MSVREAVDAVLLGVMRAMMIGLFAIMFHEYVRYNMDVIMYVWRLL